LVSHSVYVLFADTARSASHTLSLHDALPIWSQRMEEVVTTGLEDHRVAALRDRPAHGPAQGEMSRVPGPPPVVVQVEVVDPLVERRTDHVRVLREGPEE